MRYAQLVMGPAGSGKSTYCSTICKHAESIGRNIQIVNLDPACEQFNYPCSADIRELIHVDDAMEDPVLHLGPNGGLVFAMEYFAENLDWLENQLGDYDDDYVLFDCPGQIELYTHLPVMKRLVSALQSWNFRVCGVFLLDTQFMLEANKFFSGCLVALSAMVGLEIPHVSVLTKMDILSKRNKKMVEQFLDPDSRVFPDDDDSAPWNKQHRKLTKLLSRVLEDYSLVTFAPLDNTDEESINDLLLIIDNCIQYGEDAEVKDRYPLEEDDEERENGKIKH